MGVATTMGANTFFWLLLVVTGGSCTNSFNVLHPTSYDCDNATGGLSSQKEILFDPDMFLNAGGYLTVVVEMHVERLATMKFYICPNEIPKDLHGPWKFDCSNRIQLDVKKDYQSAIFDHKLQYYYDVTFINVKIPKDIGCSRCGLQIVAEFKVTPNSVPYDIQTVCAFIHIEYSKGNRAILILAPIKIYRPQVSVAPPKRLPNQSGMPFKPTRRQHRKNRNARKGGKGKAAPQTIKPIPSTTTAPFNQTSQLPEPRPPHKPHKPHPHKPHHPHRPDHPHKPVHPHKPHKLGRRNRNKNARGGKKHH